MAASVLPGLNANHGVTPGRPQQLQHHPLIQPSTPCFLYSRVIVTFKASACTNYSVTMPTFNPVSRCRLEIVPLGFYYWLLVML